VTQQALLGTRIGPYEVVGWLGAGGMGEVYRARDQRLGRDVALKLITTSLASDAGRVRRFEQEARAAGQLNHPNVLSVYDIGVHEGAPYIVSELLEGTTLRSRLADGALPWRRVLDYVKQVAEGLAAAHDRGIVHRDVKPDNLFITTDGRIKILDFGIAKLQSTDDASGQQTGLPTDTAVGTAIGTAAYMSPEQVRGEPVDARSDIFSLGAVLYEMITGRPAFRRETSPETMAAILKEDPPAPATIPEAPAVTRIVDRCLEKTRETRFQSARDLAFGLDVLSGTQPAAALVAAPRRPWLTALGAAIVVLSAAAVLAIWFKRTAPAPVENLLANATFSWFTDFEGSETDASISPDGKFVVFLADRNGPFHAWIKQVGTGSFIDLTPGQGDQTNTGPNRSVGFSGDGSEVWLNGSTDRRLTLLPLMGGTPHAFLSEHAVNVGYSPDGTRLVYFTYDGDPLIVADASGGNEHQIIPAVNGDHNHFPAFSTDGRWIYYTRWSHSVTDADIWRIPATGGAREQLTELHTDVRYLTPIDIHTVLFVAPDYDRSGPWLWALDVDRHVTTRVSIGLDRYLSVAASANGRRLVATVAKSTAGLWSVPILDRLVEERDVTPVPLSTARGLAPRFGRGAVFYLSSSGGGEGLWRQQDGRAAVDIRIGSDGPLEAPAVSPDGDRVAVVLVIHGKERLATVSADGADLRLLAETLDARGTSSWSPDGNFIFIGGSDAEGPGLFRVPVNGGPPARLMKGPAGDPVVSPNGQIIVYLGLQTAFAPLLAMRVDGTPVPLPPIRILTGGRGRFRFLPDGRLVYLLGESGAQDFWVLDPTTNVSRRMTRLSSPGTISTFDVAPDGSRIIFDRVRELSDIALIDLHR
jgi:serine/threonine protein kinase/Tol biopolymer transport system component